MKVHTRALMLGPQIVTWLRYSKELRKVAGRLWARSRGIVPGLKECDGSEVLQMTLSEKGRGMQLVSPLVLNKERRGNPTITRTRVHEC